MSGQILCTHGDDRSMKDAAVFTLADARSTKDAVVFTLADDRSVERAILPTNRDDGTRLGREICTKTWCRHDPRITARRRRLVTTRSAERVLIVTPVTASV